MQVVVPFPDPSTTCCTCTCTIICEHTHTTHIHTVGKQAVPSKYGEEYRGQQGLGYL